MTLTRVPVGVALLAAERETLPVRRLEQRSQLPGLFGELGVVRIEVRQALRVGSLMAVTVVARCNFQSLWLAGSVCSCPGNGRFRDGREGGCKAGRRSHRGRSAPMTLMTCPDAGQHHTAWSSLALGASGWESGCCGHSGQVAGRPTAASSSISHSCS